MNRNLAAAVLGVLAGGVSSVNAYEFRCRFIERVGNTDVILSGDTIEVANGARRRVRIQFGVFDDAAGAAPAGGFVGWNVGSISISGADDNSDESRSPGRLGPFNFATGVNSNGNPPVAGGGDPFEMLTEIDATLGTQSPIWLCSAGGVAPPQPAALVRGRNTYISVYEITLHPRLVGVQNYTVTVAGNLIAATEWREVGTPTPPDCGDPADPADDTPGSVTYAPFPTAPQSFTRVLNAIIPGPGSAALLAFGAVLGVRRKRA